MTASSRHQAAPSYEMILALAGMCQVPDGSIDRRQFRARCCHHGSGELQFWPRGVLSGDSGLLLRISFEVVPSKALPKISRAF